LEIIKDFASLTQVEKQMRSERKKRKKERKGAANRRVQGKDDDRIAGKMMERTRGWRWITEESQLGETALIGDSAHRK
jgi:hypothetical protein